MPMVEERLLSYAQHDKLVLLLDVDGTLIPFADSLDEAILDRAGANLLDALAFTGIQVVLVSGRPLEYVERLRSLVPKVWCSAEHGVWWRDDEARWQGASADPELDALATALSPIGRVLGTVIERKSRGLCVHWRRVPLLDQRQVIDWTEQAFASWLASRAAYERLGGNHTLEIRHRSATKASVVERVRALRPGCRLLAIGDDVTDEDMFAALGSDGIGIAVRNGIVRPTRAATALSDSVAVRAFLWWLIELRSRRTSQVPGGLLARDP
jgi:trehalose-phosphatase